MESTIQAALHAAGLDTLLPLLLALHATASALDALMPQPAPGSHWLPLRKLISVAAANIHNATNAAQPALITWVQRIAGLLVALLPPAPVPAAPAPRIDPTIDPVPPAPASIFPPLPVSPNS